MKRSTTSSRAVPAKARRREPDETKYGASGVVLLVSGTTHQGDARFNGRSVQCTANAATACMLSVIKNRSLFTVQDIDIILESGDALYVQLEPYIPAHVTTRYLSADDLPSEIRVGQNVVIIDDMTRNWIANGLYPNQGSNSDVAISTLSDLLGNEVFNAYHDDNTDGILFTGNGYTVCFWRYNNQFYLFNSHAVDESNRNSSNGVARLFQCDDLKSLAKTLINYSCAFDGSQYSLSRVRVVSYHSTEGTSVSSVGWTQDSETILVSPAVVTAPTQSDASVERTHNSETILNNFVSPSDVAALMEQCIIEVNHSTEGTSLSPVGRTQESETINLVSPAVVTAPTQSDASVERTHNSETILNNFVSPSDVAASMEKCSNEVTTPGSASILNNFLTLEPAPTKTDAVIRRSDSAILNDSEQSIIVQNNRQNCSTTLKKDAKLTNLQPVVVIENIGDHKLSILKPVVIVEQLSLKTSTSSAKKGRPKKQVRGRKKTKTNAHLDAVKKYNLKKPEMHRKSVQKYTEKNPDVHRQSVQKYTENNPDVHRQSVQKYTENNPDVHRQSVQKYVENNPEINQDSVTRYNQVSRGIDVPLRRSHNLIGEKHGEELKAINPFSLKKPSLFSPDIHKCPHCCAPLFEEEKLRIQWCCGSGAHNVQRFIPLTEDFYSHPSFEKRSRAYNNLFAFSALGVSHGFHQPPDGISFLKIQGRIYHRVFDLAYNRSTNNIGLYINDGSEREGLAIGQNLDVQVVRSITNFLHNVNPHIECFKRLSLEPSEEAFIRFEKTSRETHGNILGDQPVGTEVAAIICTDREEYTPHCIAVWKIGLRQPHTVDILNLMYESFQYPLLYPEGNAGWYPGKNDNRGNKLTQNKYVRCLLLSETRFSHLGRLSEEWLVDMYFRISEERLRYLKHMQTRDNSNELRAAPLQELLNDETIDAEGVTPGRIYLPSTFTGGPRYMKVRYLDCIALVNRLGNPSYFITFTCNQNWPEIKRSTPSGQRPDPLICARAFNLRLTALIRDFRSGLWFGKIEYLMYVIEFQKRGLPHAHICFRVEGGGPVENTDIDKVCRADIPTVEEAEGELRKSVLGHMIHGPCGPPPRHRDDLLCYDKEKRMCTRRFPKRETDVTFCDEKGFINLRRSASNEAVIRYRGREYKVNDLWVVPYNAALLLKYDAHINVEMSSRRSVVKYLFKYMTKGPDEARVAIVAEDRNNEIEEYVTKRYIGSSDAAWRVLEFDITAREPNVKQLSVHLQNQQTVYFRPNTVAEAITRGGGSDLITYFNRPLGEEFDRLKYVDFYERFIVHSKRPSDRTKVQVYETTNGKFVTPRQRGEIVARLFWVAPNRGEQFYLRILLNSFPCRSYADLISLGGSDCTTFQDAAKAVGLADDEVEYEGALQEASTFFTGSRLRKFFVLLAVNGAPVASLWDKFKNQLSEDILHRMPGEEERAHDLCLIQINRLLGKHGSSLVQNGLPDVQDDTTELGRERVEYGLNAQKSIVDEWLSKLSSDQRAVYDYIDRLCVDDQYREANPTAVFIDGPAGTGKTLLLSVITAHVRGDLTGVVLCTASSAIAAQNYEGGVTAHSMFKFPLDLVDDSGYWSITNGTQRANLIYHADVLIYDEAPMAHKYLIHLLDRSLRDLMKSDKIFGGKIIIFAGDFRQIPPVVPNARSNSDVFNCSVKTSPLWRKLKTFSLLTSQRCRDDPEYAEFLLRLGSNELPTDTFVIRGNVQRLVSLELIECVTQLKELIDFVFPHVVIDEPDVCAHRAILCTRNDAVREINLHILQNVPGEMLHFYSFDKVESENADQLYLGTDALNRMQPPGVPEFDLKLKIGCVCMIIRNLSFADGLVNGTKVIVVSTTPRLIAVRKPGGHDTYLIPRILFKAPVDRNSAFEMYRRQFPLQVCYAMTIHKSQGQTIGRVGVDLRSDVFSHGQLYVALGRVRERGNIKVLVKTDRIRNGLTFANNVVIPQLLL